MKSYGGYYCGYLRVPDNRDSIKMFMYHEQNI